MCRGEFMDKTSEKAWTFSEEYAEKDQMWKSIHGLARTNLRGVHVVGPSIFSTKKSQAEEGLPPVYPQEQVNAFASTNSYGSHYNSNRRNHPNLSWSNPNNFLNPSHFYPMSQNTQVPNQQFVPQKKSLSKQPYRPPHLRNSPQISQQSQDYNRLDRKI